MVYVATDGKTDDELRLEVDNAEIAVQNGIARVFLLRHAILERLAERLDREGEPRLARKCRREARYYLHKSGDGYTLARRALRIPWMVRMFG